MSIRLKRAQAVPTAVSGDGRARPLPESFYTRPTLEVARDLIGRHLVTVRGGRRTSGRIVEVEAYLGPEDPASHAARGPTPRSAIMFGQPGVAYVYFIYGMHHCLNVVTERAGRAGAVLIRAIEPLQGQQTMLRRHRRPARRDRAGGPLRPGPAQLCNGPGKVCRALGIDLRWNGLSLQGQSPGPFRIWLERGSGARPTIVTTTRVGIRRAADRPYRFLAAESDSVSLAHEVSAPAPYT